MPWSDVSHRYEPGVGVRVTSLLLLLLPTALLGVAAAWLNSIPLAVGAGVQSLYAVVFVRQHPVWRPPIAPSVVVLYIVALGWSWLATRTVSDPVLFATQGLLVIVAVGLFAIHDLIRSGAEPLRRANRYARRLMSRSAWPAESGGCRNLPEVQGLRNAVRDVAGPALAMLADPRTEVQTAALAALEYRQTWRPGEAELVLLTAQLSPDPAVRAAAAYALAGVETADLVAGLAGLLRDPAPEVRRAAAEALLWDGDRRWPLARAAVHATLSEPKLKFNGLFTGAVRLPAAAISDLSLWASERPPVSARAIQILIEQYSRGLSDPNRPELASDLARQMLNAETDAALRVELAALLRDHQMLTPDLLDRLTNADQPGSLRLLAAEVMLRLDPNDPDGVDVLRGLARQPNREMALAVGAILQNVLGLPLGLPPDYLPAAGSKQAADVARRVLAWANGALPDQFGTPSPAPMPGLGLKVKSRPPFGGLKPTSVLPHELPPRPGANG